MATPDDVHEAMLDGMEQLVAAMKDRKPAATAVSDGSEPTPSEAHDARGPERARALPRGAIVGRHVVLEELGAGGMGVVYAAYDPELDRKVALKLLRPGLGGERARTRLLREAQALGKLAHPHVVGIHDVGTLGEQVWLAMEFVEGETLGAWLRTRRRWREVLGVLRDAGEGLVAAHAAGLLHRDFKPDNVMIASDGRVRVMDFGLARARPKPTRPAVDRFGPQPAVETLALPLTQAGAIVGTPSYMAPEQFTASELTAAADQFAFCVTLWEGLYGERPFGGRTLGELVDEVLAGRRRPPPSRPRVPGRLRRACERGLSVDPQQRWPSMDALLRELRRIAAPRTRRWLAVGIAAGLGALGLGLARYAEVGFRCDGAQAWLAGIWDDARKQEVKAAILGTERVFAPGTWERVQARLDDYAQALADAHTEVCTATRVTEEQSEAAMDLRMGCLRERKTALHATVSVLAQADDEIVEKAVTLAAGLPTLRRCDDVERLAEQRQRVPPPEDPQVEAEVEALREQLAAIDAEQRAGKYAPALARIEPVMQRADALGYMPLVAEAHWLRGRLRDKHGQYADAEQDLTRAHELASEHGHDDVVRGAATNLTYTVGYRQERHAEGLLWGRTALPLATRSGDATHLAAISTNLGIVLKAQGSYAESEQHYRRALELDQSVRGADHPVVAVGLSNLGQTLSLQGRYEEAEQELRRALEIEERTLGAEHPLVAQVHDNLGIVLAEAGRYDEAKDHFRRALDLFERVLGPDHPDLAKTANNLGAVLILEGRYEEAEAQHRRALAIRERVLGADHPLVAFSVDNLGAALLGRGRYADAEPLHRRALEIRERTLPADHPDLAASLGNLGLALAGQGRHAEAEPLHRRALEIRERALGADHPLVARTQVALASALHDQGRLEEALALYQRALDGRMKALGPRHPDVAASLDHVADVLRALGRLEEALTYQQRAASCRATPPAG